MARQIQIRRGSATDHENFTGAIGEITMDTTNKTLRVHDGTTAGGTILAKQSEIPTSFNAFPDLSSPTNITGITNQPTSVNIPSDGYIQIDLYFCNGGETLVIDNTAVFCMRDFGQDNWHYISPFIPIAKGTHTINVGFIASRINSLRFYPCKG